jgi:hypothetical protein
LGRNFLGVLHGEAATWRIFIGWVSVMGKGGLWGRGLRRFEEANLQKRINQ